MSPKFDLFFQRNNIGYYCLSMDTNNLRIFRNPTLVQIWSLLSKCFANDNTIDFVAFGIWFLGDQTLWNIWKLLFQSKHKKFQHFGDLKTITIFSLIFQVLSKWLISMFSLCLGKLIQGCSQWSCKLLSYYQHNKFQHFLGTNKALQSLIIFFKFFPNHRWGIPSYQNFVMMSIQSNLTVFGNPNLVSTS